MDKGLIITKRITIYANSKIIWEVLTNSEKIKVYSFSVNTISDWQKGSKIIFEGVNRGVKYRNRGIIVAIEPEKELKYKYWSIFSGYENKPENYSLITYTLEPESDKTILKLTEQGFRDEQALRHAERVWSAVLEKLKVAAENSAS